MATGSYQYSISWNHQTKRIEIIKNHGSNAIPCSNDCICTTLLIQTCLKTTTQQHHVTYVCCPFPSRPILPQCSLTVVANQILQWAHRDHNSFSRVSSQYEYLQGLQICCKSRSKCGFDMFSQFAGDPRRNSLFFGIETAASYLSTAY